MDSLITFIKKNTAAAVIMFLLLPIGGALIYGSVKSLWVRRRNKKESAIIYDFLIASKAYDQAFTTKEISRATKIPPDRVVGHCSDHDDIEDAGKRQRSWKLAKDD
jgi:hypothetical protein